MKNKRLKEFFGYLLFFITVTAIVTVAFLAYGIFSDESNKVISLVMIITILAISTLLTLADVIRRKIMIDKPVKEILSATDKIASGDFSVRLKPSHTYGKFDEFDLIKENLNKMASELQKSEVLKTDFISNVSHELKTPIAIIKSYSALLEKEQDAEKRAEYRHQISTASTRLSDLVGNILKLNKLENQSLTIERETIRLNEMLEECIISFESVIEKKGLLLECDIDEIVISSSRSYLEIVWNNLLSNAIKFTENGGTISVSAKWVDGCAVVKVCDTGCGIDAETGKHIFDKFYQGDTSHAGEGNGLGLALVKKVIDNIGGEISVSSELGKGTSFTVKLS